MRLTDKISGRPAISPDGNFLATLYREEALKVPKLGIFSSDGGEPIRLIDVQRSSPLFKWTADAQAIIFISARGSGSNLWRQPVDGGEPKALTNFTGDDQIFWFAWSNDFQTLAFARGKTESDVLMLSFAR